MFIRLCVLFVAIPCIELVLLMGLGGRIGLGPTLGIILLTGVVGAWLARRQGASALRRIQKTLAAGQLPATEMVDGLLIFAAGLLLITPGFLTDTVGFGLLIPQARSWLRQRVTAAFKRHLGPQAAFGVHAWGPAPDSDPGTIEGKAIRVEDADP